VALMLLLAIGGRRGSALRMLAAVCGVYAVSEVLGALWPRQRPFARLSEIEALVRHDAGRSFPSRHVASGLAMAAIGGRAHPRLGLLMSLVAWLLGLSRVAAGLHYPTDVLAGAVLGLCIGRYAHRRKPRYAHGS
jgi:undecaprenyl-diphosphatase